jgi:hypothetical protein
MDLEIIGTTPAPSRLGPVPEFGRNGEAPPLRTEPVIVSWALLTFTFRQSLAETSAPPLTEQELVEHLNKSYKRRLPIRPYEPSSEWLIKKPSFIRFLMQKHDSLPIFVSAEDILSSLESESEPENLDSIDYRATKRLLYSQYWERDDPVIQLAPGETQVASVQLKSGLTDQVLREFSSSLGLGAKLTAVELSTQLSGRLSRTVTVSTELQTTMTKQLTNSREGYTRRVAVWHVVHSISLYQVATAPVGPPFVSAFQWIQLQNFEFTGITAPQSSYFDIRHP